MSIVSIRLQSFSFLLVWDCVRDNELLQVASVELFNRVSRQNTVSDDGNGFPSTMLHDYISGLHQSTARVGHVVDDDSDAVFHVTDQDHARNLVRAGSFFVDEGEAEVEAVSDGCSSNPMLALFLDGYSERIDIPLRSTCVRADNHTFLHIQVFPDPPQSTWLSVQVVHGHIEEPLNLAGVQIHSDDMVAPCRLQHIRHQLGGDRSSTLILLVLSGIWEVGKHGGDAARRGSSAGVNEDEQLHNVVVNVPRRGGLEDEDVFIADGLADGDTGLVVGILEDHDFGELDA